MAPKRQRNAAGKGEGSAEQEPPPKRRPTKATRQANVEQEPATEAAEAPPSPPRLAADHQPPAAASDQQGEPSNATVSHCLIQYMFYLS